MRRVRYQIYAGYTGIQYFLTACNFVVCDCCSFFWFWHFNCELGTTYSPFFRKTYRMPKSMYCCRRNCHLNLVSINLIYLLCNAGDVADIPLVLLRNVARFCRWVIPIFLTRSLSVRKVFILLPVLFHRQRCGSGIQCFLRRIWGGNRDPG